MPDKPDPKTTPAPLDWGQARNLLATCRRLAAEYAAEARAVAEPPIQQPTPRINLMFDLALEGQIKRLRRALDLCMVGGNHLATHVDMDGPDWRASPDVALEHYGAGLAYDAWCCWASIMQAREIADD